MIVFMRMVKLVFAAQKKQKQQPQRTKYHISPPAKEAYYTTAKNKESTVTIIATNALFLLRAYAHIHAYTGTYTNCMRKHLIALRIHRCTHTHEHLLAYPLKH